MVKKQSNKSKTASFKDKLVSSAIKKLYNKSAPLLVCEAILFIVAAVLIFFKPVAILATVTFIFGVALAVFGLYQVCIAFFGEKKSSAEKTLLAVLGFISIVLGAVFFVQPAGSMITVVYMFALLFLFKGIKALLLSIKMAKYKFGHYILDIIISGILVVVALLIMFFPIAGVVTMMYYLGLVLLLYAGSDVYMYMELRKLKKLAS